MDVGSLLNGPPEGEERPQLQPLITWKAPMRNRTPWDAGGYSLPVNSLSVNNSLDATLSMNNYNGNLNHNTNHIHYNDSLSDYPTIYASKHSLSDSRSSLSSFASASTSTHSRYSSASTVSGFHAFATLSSQDSKYPDNLQEPQSLVTPSSALSPISPAAFSFRHHPMSPISEPLKVLAFIAERQYSESSSEEYQQDAFNEAMTDKEMKDANDVMSDDVQPISRPASPTDAVFIRRTASISSQPDSMENRSEMTVLDSIDKPSQAAGTVLETSEDPFEGFHNRRRLPPVTTRCFESHSSRNAALHQHKRAYSAPSIRVPNVSLLHGGASSPTYYPTTHSEPTPPLSTHPGSESPTTASTMAHANLPCTRLTPPENSPPLESSLLNKSDLAQNDTLPTFEFTPVCLFKEGCDTGSQLRKAVSHIFGRNKMCTRLIPDLVWVRYCRKHYQRSRYREPKNWPRSQCDLVQQQIIRLEDWSAVNRARGEGGVVRSWGLAVRKREQQRLDQLAAQNVNNNDNEGLDSKEHESVSAPATAVPAWLRQLCGRTYSTDEIKDIFTRVHMDLMNSISPVFPDIEILPHITLDGEEESRTEIARAGSLGSQEGGNSSGLTSMGLSGRSAMASALNGGFGAGMGTGMGHTRSRSMGVGMGGGFGANGRNSAFGPGSLSHLNPSTYQNRSNMFVPPPSPLKRKRESDIFDDTEMVDVHGQSHGQGTANPNQRPRLTLSPEQHMGTQELSHRPGLHAGERAGYGRRTPLPSLVIPDQAERWGNGRGTPGSAGPRLTPPSAGSHRRVVSDVGRLSGFGGAAGGGGYGYSEDRGAPFGHGNEVPGLLNPFTESREENQRRQHGRSLSSVSTHDHGHSAVYCQTQDQCSGYRAPSSSVETPQTTRYFGPPTQESQGERTAIFNPSPLSTRSASGHQHHASESSMSGCPSSTSQIPFNSGFSHHGQGHSPRHSRHQSTTAIPSTRSTNVFDHHQAQGQGNGGNVEMGHANNNTINNMLPRAHPSTRESQRAKEIYGSRR